MIPLEFGLWAAMCVGFAAGWYVGSYTKAREVERRYRRQRERARRRRASV